jgi:hypothetical protein
MLPAALEDLLRHGQQRGVGDVLVDHGAQAVRGRLGAKVSRCAARRTRVASPTAKLSSRSDGRDTEALRPRAARIARPTSSAPANGRRWTGTPAWPTRGPWRRGAADPLGKRRRGAFAHGAGGHARVAEPAALRAAAQHLQREAVVDELGVRNDVLLRHGGAAQVAHHPPGDLHAGVGEGLPVHRLHGMQRGTYTPGTAATAPAAGGAARRAGAAGARAISTTASSPSPMTKKSRNGEAAPGWWPWGRPRRRAARRPRAPPTAREIRRGPWFRTFTQVSSD